MFALRYGLPLGVLAAVALGLAGPELAVPACVACIHWWCPSVVGPCVVVPPPGPGALACMAAACGIPCAAACTVTWCFDGDTLFATPHGDVPASTLKKGDLILAESESDGTSFFTAVTDVGYIEKDVEMLTLTLASGASLTATSSHTHFVAEEGRRVRTRGSELEVGMVMFTRDGANSTIVAIATSASPGKWSVATEPCNAYANGVLTATSCATIDVPMPTFPGTPEFRFSHGEADIGSARERNMLNNFSGRAFRWVLAVDGKEESGELGPEALGLAVADGLSWHMKAESVRK